MLPDAIHPVFYRRRFALFLSATIFLIMTHAGAAYASSIRVGHADLNDIQNTTGGVTTQSANSALTIPANQQTITYTFPTYTTPFRFNALGITFTGSLPPNTLEASVTTTNQNGTTLVRHLDIVGDDRKNNDTTYATQPVIVENVRSFTLTVTLKKNNGVTPIISDLDITYVNTLTSATNSLSSAHSATTTPEETTEATSTQPEETTNDEQYPTSTTPLFEYTPASTLNIISRADWGADESYRYTTDTETEEKTVIWPSEYIQPQVFIVHHTAGSDGGEDPAATIRAIYYFHAVVYGWGDIGYNYLIDPAGNIYEGRYGGDGVVGGHAYNSLTHVGFNIGSVGISLLGCYESTADACLTQNTLSQATLNALTALVAEKAKLFDINVAEEITFHNTLVHRLIGHREVSSTFCPGDTTMTYMSTLRATIASAAPTTRLLHDSEIVSTTLTDALDNPVTVDKLQADTDYTLNLVVENTGIRRWMRKKTYIVISNGEDDTTPSRFLSELWPATDGHMKWDKGTKKVFRDQTITWTIPIHTPSSMPNDIDIHVHIYANVKYPPTLREVGSIHELFPQ